jgi:hypothetical protein
MTRQLSFHIPGEWCNIRMDEPSCDVCDRNFNISESRVMNDCSVWADLLGFPEWGSEFYLTGPADCLDWLLQEHLTSA